MVIYPPSPYSTSLGGFLPVEAVSGIFSVSMVAQPCFPGAVTTSPNLTFIFDPHLINVHHPLFPSFHEPTSYSPAFERRGALERRLSTGDFGEIRREVDLRLEELLTFDQNKDHEIVYGDFPCVEFDGPWPDQPHLDLDPDKIGRVVRRFGMVPLLQAYPSGIYSSISLYARQNRIGTYGLYEDRRLERHEGPWDLAMENLVDLELNNPRLRDEEKADLGTVRIPGGFLRSYMETQLHDRLKEFEQTLPPGSPSTVALSSLVRRCRDAGSADPTAARAIAMDLMNLARRSRHFKVAADSGLAYLTTAVLISRDLDLFQAVGPEIIFQISERKTESGDSLISATLPNGDLVRSFICRLQKDSEGRNLLTYARERGNGSSRLDHWACPSVVEALRAALEKTAEASDAKTVEVRSHAAINWVQGFWTPDAPPSPEILAGLSRWRHPHESLFMPGTGTYEAMRPLKQGHVEIVTPWLQGILSNDLLLRDVDPEPSAEKASDYVFAFSGRTGRSADYAVEIATPDGVLWRHLNAIGVGKTTLARVGSEKRDGLLPREGAWQRFYLSNLLHRVAGPHGFRTSLGAAIVDRERNREDSERWPGLIPGVFQRQATLYELRREQLRLEDLSDPSRRRAMLDFVKARLAGEFGEMDDEMYVLWLARTLGEQFAIMRFFGFDHGEHDKTPQLHSGNVSLAGEIFDFDAGRLNRDAKVVAARYNSKNEVSLKAIERMQKGGVGPFFHSRWIEPILSFAPSVDFARTATIALKRKLEELEGKKIQPRVEINAFNRQVWNPLKPKKASP